MELVMIAAYLNSEVDTSDTTKGEKIENRAGHTTASPPAFCQRRASSLAKELEKADQLRAKLKAKLQEAVEAKVETEESGQKSKQKLNTSSQAKGVATRGKGTSDALKAALALEKESDEERNTKRAKVEQKRAAKKQSKKAQDQIKKLMKD